ncbi:hypothetical protein HYX58_00485 [Candidatus Dependentiae bacterium]|nr:hypothetical protein [Candidatus Dependentiae bacterium]
MNLLRIFCAVLIFFSFDHYAMENPNVVTDLATQYSDSTIRINFINNMLDTTERKSIDPLQTDFQRLLKRKAQSHIFISYMVWKVFLDLQKRSAQKLGTKYWYAENSKEVAKYLLGGEEKIKDDDGALVAFNKNQWCFYDTKLGLYYLEPADLKENYIVKKEKFALIDHPEGLSSVPSNSMNWACEMNCLLHCQPVDETAQFLFHLNGHGNPEKSELPILCGLVPERMTSLLCYLNSEFPRSTIGVESCYASPERISRLMNNEKISFSLITSVQRDVVSYADDPPLFQIATNGKKEKRKFEMLERNDDKTFLQLMEKVHKNIVYGARGDKTDSAIAALSYFTASTNIPGIKFSDGDCIL